MIKQAQLANFVVKLSLFSWLLLQKNVRNGPFETILMFLNS